LTAQLSQKFDVCAELSNDITMMKVTSRWTHQPFAVLINC